MFVSVSIVSCNNYWLKLWVVWMLYLSAFSPSSRRAGSAHAFRVAASFRPSRMHPSVETSTVTTKLRQFHCTSSMLPYDALSKHKAKSSTVNYPHPHLMMRFSTTRLFASSSIGGRRNDDDTNDNNDDWKVPDTIHIPEETLNMSFVRSSGSGGQNVNKVNTQVQIKVLIDAMGWIPYEVRERLRKQQANRINKEGYLVLHVQEYRTQTQNRKAAVQKLRDMIVQAWPRPKKRNVRTGISEKTKKQRREQKQKRKLVKESRRSVQF